MLPSCRQVGAFRPRTGSGGRLEKPTFSMTPLSLSAASPQSSAPSPQSHSFHSSPRVSYDSTSYNAAEVPNFFVTYKQRRASHPESAVHDHPELGLMPVLTRSIQSDDVATSTRRLESKVPVEHHSAEGHIVHSSGFVAPGPGHACPSGAARAKEKERNEDLDLAIQTAGVARNVMESDYKTVDATTVPLPSKVPFEIPEADGSVSHPSGFNPPTPAAKFRYIAPTNILGGRKVSAPRPKVRQPIQARAVYRAVHTAAPNASED